MFRWIPWIVSRGPEIEAPDRIRALDAAIAIHGADLVSVEALPDGAWCPMVVRRAPVIEARAKADAERIAEAIHGSALVRVQSVASHEVYLDDLAAVEQRRLREDDGA